MTESDERKEQPKTSNSKGPSKEFSKLIYGVFFWCMIGVSVIYGIRLYFDVPIHSSFLPIIGAVFAGILAFTLVVSFQSKAGPIDIKLGENIGFSGAGGPLILWCICFLVIVYGLYLLGITDAIKQSPNDKNYEACAVHTLIKSGGCPNKSPQPTALLHGG